MENDSEQLHNVDVSEHLSCQVEIAKEGSGDKGVKNSEKKEEDVKRSVPFVKLFMLADTIDIVLMTIGTLGSIVNGMAVPTMALVFGSLIDAFGENSGDAVQEEVSTVCLRFVFLGIGAGVGSFFQVSCWMCSAERQTARMRNLYLKTILRQEIAFFDIETSTGEVVGAISEDIMLVQEAIGDKVGTFIQFVTTFFGGIIIAFIKGWKLSLAIIGALPLLMVVAGMIALLITKTSSNSQKAYEKAGAKVKQTLDAIRTVVSFIGESKAINEYDQSLVPAYTATIQQSLANGFGLGAFLFIMFCTYAMALWYGSRLIINEGYSGGRVISVIFAVLIGGICLGQTTPSINAMAKGKVAAYKMFETFKRKPQIDAYDTDGIVLENIHGDINLRDIYFSYPARPDVQIFSRFSLHIPTGTSTAIVGESGSGKSTVISLIERFYDPQSGEVQIDGINIMNFQLKWIRDKISLVSQEPVLFSTTIKENIAYGKEGATLEEIKVAAEIANASNFISKMPMGLETMVGEHGAQLSGGQKQRVAIARAILKNPRILLLDEATSALDVASERVVQQALDRIMSNRTTVIVAHRLTTVKNANTIAVIQCGSIVEKGPHSELIMNPLGAYSQLVSLQQMHEPNGKESAKDTHVFEISEDEVIGTSTDQKSLPKLPPFKQLSVRDSSSRRISSGNSSGQLTGQSSITRNKEEENSLSAMALFFKRRGKNDVENGNLNVQENVPILRLARLNKPEVPILLFGCFAAIFTGLAFPIFGLLFSSVVDSFYKPSHELRKDIRFWSLMFVALAASQLLMMPLQYYSFAVAGGRLVQRVRSLTFKRVIYQEIGWFDDNENSSGAIAAKLSTDAANVRDVVGDALSLLVQNIATIATGIIIGFIANWKLSFILLALVPLLGVQGWVEVKLFQGLSADAKVKYEQASQVANEAVGSIRTVASFCAEEKVLRLYINKCSEPLKSGTKKGLISGVGLGFSNFVMFATYATVFYVGARMVKNGETEFGDVFKVFFGIAMAAMGVSQSMAMAPDIGKVKNSVNSVFRLLDRKSKVDASDESGIIPESVKGDIELRHVSFRYPARQDVQIFRDLSILFPSDNTVALVGESGCGKSTVISLLQRFYVPDSGTILLDGIEIPKIQVKWLRFQMGLVCQEPVLFNDTIRANIAYGKDGKVFEEQIIEASQASNAHNFISTFRQGYETLVGERGIQLSGGQKQRVAIARAIVKDPKILLLDEATSALDAESERLVQGALDNVKTNRTTIMIAHRLSTIKDADKIVVVKNGVVAEEGKHDDLLAIKGGAYEALVKLHMASSEST